MSQLFIQTSCTDTRTMFNKYKRGICFGNYQQAGRQLLS